MIATTIRNPAFEWRGRRLLEPATAPLYAVLGIEAAIVLAALASGRFDADAAMLGGVLAESAVIAFFAWAIRWIGFARVAAFVEITAVSIASAILAAAASLVLASSALPLADGVLAAADIALFQFDRSHIAALTNHAAASRASLWVYNSVAVSLHLVLVGLLWRRGTRATLRYAAALQLATLGSILVMPLVPAFGVPPYPYAFADIFAGVRDGTLRTIEHATLSGLVTFPSMHAAGGALLVWGFAQVGRWAAPLAALNVLVVLSALTSGGHYLVDVGGGLILALLAIAAARRLIPNEPPRSSASAGAAAAPTGLPRR